MSSELSQNNLVLFKLVADSVNLISLKHFNTNLVLYR